MRKDKGRRKSKKKGVSEVGKSFTSQAGWPWGLAVLGVALAAVLLSSCRTNPETDQNVGNNRLYYERLPSLVVQKQIAQGQVFWGEKVEQFRQALKYNLVEFEPAGLAMADKVPFNIRRPMPNFPVLPKENFPDEESWRQAYRSLVEHHKKSEAEIQKQVGSWYREVLDWPDRDYTLEEMFLVRGGWLRFDMNKDGTIDLEVPVSVSFQDAVAIFYRKAGRYPTSTLEMISVLYPASEMQGKSEQEIFAELAPYFNPFTAELRSFYTNSEPDNPQPGDVFMHLFTPQELAAVNPDRPTGPISLASNRKEAEGTNVWFYKMYGENGQLLELLPFIRYSQKSGL